MEREEPTQDSIDDLTTLQRHARTNRSSSGSAEPVDDYPKLVSPSEDPNNVFPVELLSDTVPRKLSGEQEELELKTCSAEALPSPPVTSNKTRKHGQKQKSSPAQRNSSPSPIPTTRPEQQRIGKEQSRKKTKKDRFEELRNIRRAMVEKLARKKSVEVTPNVTSIQKPEESAKNPFGNRGNQTRKREVQENVKKKKQSAEEKTQDSQKEELQLSTRQKIMDRVERFRASFLNRFKKKNSENKSKAKEKEKPTPPKELSDSDIKKRKKQNSGSGKNESPTGGAKKNPAKK